jgi:hypothetical protein
VSLSDKVLIAALAAEWTLTGMGSHMSFEVASLREFFEALDEWTQ